MKKVITLLIFSCSSMAHGQELLHNIIDADEDYEKISLSKTDGILVNKDGIVQNISAGPEGFMVSGSGALNVDELLLSDSVMIGFSGTIADDKELSILSGELISSNACLLPLGHINIQTEKFEGNISVLAPLFGEAPKVYPLLFYKEASKPGNNGGNGGGGGNGRNAGAKFKWGIPKSYGSTSGGNGGAGQPGQNGGNGFPGLSGESGRMSGNIKFVISKIKRHSKVTLIARGENGTDGTVGQNGGAGGDGGYGGNGGNGGEAAYDRNASSGGRGGNGGDGGNGGRGGDGGHGGKGGDGGNITLDYGKKAPSWDWFFIDTMGGSGGKGANGGYGGKGGKGGNPGNGGHGGDGSFFKHGGSSGLAGQPGNPGKRGIDGNPGIDGPNGREGVAKLPILIIRGERAEFPFEVPVAPVNSSTSFSL